MRGTIFFEFLEKISTFFKNLFLMVKGQVMFHIFTAIVILSFLCSFHSNYAVWIKRVTDPPTSRRTHLKSNRSCFLLPATGKWRWTLHQSASYFQEGIVSWPCEDFGPGLLLFADWCATKKRTGTAFRREMLASSWHVSARVHAYLGLSPRTFEVHTPMNLFCEQDRIHELGHLSLLRGHGHS